MKPLRFLVIFVLYYLIGSAGSWFFLFSANYLREPRIVFISLLFSFALAFLFSWLYFRKVKSISWRERFEAIAVWMGMLLIFDAMSLVFIYKRSIGDLGVMTIFGYSVTLLTIFVSAYITSSQHPKFVESPNLLDTESTDAV